MKYSKWNCILMALIFAVGAWGCSSTKHVPQGEYLLDKVKIEVVDNDDIGSSDLYNYLRQTPNHKVLGFAKLQLGVYSLSGRDSTKWYNRWLRALGKPPVIYSTDLTEGSVRQLERALENKGYLGARVSFDTIPGNKRMNVVYKVTTGEPHRISALTRQIADPAIDSILEAEPHLMTMGAGDLFDRNNLDAMRAGIAQRLQNRGYYSFTKDNIGFIADTVAGSRDVALTMTVRKPHNPSVQDTLYHKYYFGRVFYVTDFNSRASAGHDLSLLTAKDTVNYGEITVLYGDDHYLTPKVLAENCYIHPGRPYSSQAIDRTYEALGRLGILKFVNIQLRPAGVLGSTEILDAYIFIDHTKKQGFTVELEGTNSEGDLGFGVGLTYQHRNLAHGSQLLTTKFRVNYESLSGNLQGLINNRYSEYAAEVGITFPRFEAPLLTRRFKRRMRASTQFALSFNYQERPEYTRVIAGGAWKYNWTNRLNTVRRTFDLVDINYVYLPRSTINFIDSIAPSNPLLRYSYEDHFIMRMGYTYRRTNRRIPSGLTKNVRQPWIYSLRASGEMAGNLLYLISTATGQHRTDGAYRLFGIQYAQYLKGEFDYSWTRNVDYRNSVALRAGVGIAFPYGNSRMVPFEKRFYAGGANSVRGWSARALGPGCYDSRNSTTDFINQCGDISLLLSAEYRAKLFWILEGALFVDAGNIWTIRDYPNQPGGVFKFDKFYKQIAASYGVGLRLDFTYFLLRLDLGMKAHNPAMNQEPWPLIHPNWKRDATIHFAVGYPF